MRTRLETDGVQPRRMRNESGFAERTTTGSATSARGSQLPRRTAKRRSALPGGSLHPGSEDPIASHAGLERCSVMGSCPLGNSAPGRFEHAFNQSVFVDKARSFSPVETPAVACRNASMEVTFAPLPEARPHAVRTRPLFCLRSPLMIFSSPARPPNSALPSPVPSSRAAIASSRRRAARSVSSRCPPKLGDALLPLKLDVRDENAVRNAIASLPEAFSQIDVLTNNAGLALGMEPAQRANLTTGRT